jgi:hypothetical protein
MRTATVVRITAVTLLGAGLGASTAGADDQIKVGKWEFTAQVPGLTQFAPDLRLQPGVEVAPGGMTKSRIHCITSANPFPPIAQGPSALRDADHPCKLDKVDVTGGTVSSSWICTTGETTVHAEWVMRYHDETSDGEFSIRVTNAGRPPIDRLQQMTGRYLGPCDDK